ncbi:TATB1 [Auxenochlorella protothecoides x Auxenochlorella symbiontica]
MQMQHRTGTQSICCRPRLSHCTSSNEGPRAFAGSSAPYFTTARPRRRAARQLLDRSRRGLAVQASFFGVGAPEAILVGVVALVVFGPKGLAQAAKSLGKTLRTFQPAIQELTQVSAELRSTLEREIGLDEVREDLRSVTRPRAPFKTLELDEDDRGVGEKGLASVGPPAAEEDDDIEVKRRASAELAWGKAGGQGGEVTQGAAGHPAKTRANLQELSEEELLGELRRRKAEMEAAVKKDAQPGSVDGK